MVLRNRILPIVLLLTLCELAIAQPPELPTGLSIDFNSESYEFSRAEIARIQAIVANSREAVSALLPDLPDWIRVSIATIDRDLTAVGGVTGMADDPNTVLVFLSTAFKGGVIAAANTGLAAVLYHEFHHLTRGWTINDNKFGPGITTAAINEGLANVFSEVYTNTAFAGNAYPRQVQQWWDEIGRLPVDASYSSWMVQHPDGRQAIGYKAGSFVIRQILAHSDYSIIQLSTMTVEEILNLAEQTLSSAP
jgi:uncharacterized protein YjaZ